MSENKPNPYTPSDEHTLSPDNRSPVVLNPNPAVKTYQRIYVILMFLMYAAIVVLVVAASFYKDAVARDLEVGPIEAMILLFILGIISAVLAIVFVVGLFWHRGLGGWIYNLILICIGLTSGCTWPITIPLMIFWIKHKDDIQHG
jgi:hypothetical protein